MIYHIRAIIYMKKFPSCNKIGFEINIYVFIFGSSVPFSICILCIFHLYEKESGVAFLTHLFPVNPFSTPWKHQKTVRFSDVFRGVEKGCIRSEWIKVFKNDRDFDS